EQDFKTFSEKYKTWRENLIREVDRITPSYAHLFNVLDKYRLNIPDNWQNISDLEKEKTKIGDQISAYTERIYKFVSEFSGLNLSNRVKK
ncbi:hypothetical protein ACFLW1_03505, partial [Chloroflexota bacterium]